MRYRAYIVRTSDGQEFHYPFSLIAFSSPWALMARLDQLRLRCGCTHGDAILDRTFGVLADILSRDSGVHVLTIHVTDLSTRAAAPIGGVVYRWER